MKPQTKNVLQNPNLPLSFGFHPWLTLNLIVNQI